MRDCDFVARAGGRGITAALYNAGGMELDVLHARAADRYRGKVARLTGLEPATPGVTGRYSNQLSYNRVRGDVGGAGDGVNGEGLCSGRGAVRSAQGDRS